MCREHARRVLFHPGLNTEAVAYTTGNDAGRPRYRYADAHFHMVDLVQEGDGLAAAIAAMERAGVSDAMVSGLPLVKKWSKDEPLRPQYYLDDDSPVYWYSATDVLVARAVLDLPAPQRRRFHPFLSGFNASDRNAIDHVRRMVMWYPGLWEGIGEVMTHHDDLTALTPGEVARPDSVALDPVFEFAAEHDLPVSVHSNIGAVGRHDPIFLHEVEHMLAKHARTRFIWCHAGISRRLVIPMLTDELRRILVAHANLWIDLSWVVYDSDVLRDSRPDPRWVRLIEDFPDRFMVGSDSAGRVGTYESTIRRYDALLDVLSPDVARRVARDNFLKLLPSRGLVR